MFKEALLPFFFLGISQACFTEIVDETLMISSEKNGFVLGLNTAEIDLVQKCIQVCPKIFFKAKNIDQIKIWISMNFKLLDKNVQFYISLEVFHNISDLDFLPRKSKIFLTNGDILIKQEDGKIFHNSKLLHQNSEYSQKNLKAASFPYQPFTYKTGFNTFGGYEVRTMKTIGQFMNFNFDIETPEDGELWGFDIGNGTFTGKLLCPAQSVRLL